MMNETFREERARVAENMILYGGSFFQHIGHALTRADHENAVKILTTWPETWAKYRDM